MQRRILSALPLAHASQQRYSPGKAPRSTTARQQQQHAHRRDKDPATSQASSVSPGEPAGYDSSCLQHRRRSTPNHDLSGASLSFLPVPRNGRSATSARPGQGESVASAKSCPTHVTLWVVELRHSHSVALAQSVHVWETSKHAGHNHATRRMRGPREVSVRRSIAGEGRRYQFSYSLSNRVSRSVRGPCFCFDFHASPCHCWMRCG